MRRSRLAMLLAVALLSSCFQGTVCTYPMDGLSSDWNDIDADAVAKEIVADCLRSGWNTTFRSQNGRNAIVKLYRVRLNSSELINNEYLTKQIERALLNSGNIDLLSDGLGEAQVGSDASFDAAAHAKREDFSLTGMVEAQDGAADGKKIRTYVTSMRLIDVRTGKQVWTGERRIRKQIEITAAPNASVRP